MGYSDRTSVEESKGKILFVDDERELAWVLRPTFRKAGYDMVSAADAKAGLALARKHRPDVIIVDVMLPVIDGMELLRLLRQETQVPIVLLTANKSEVNRVLAFKLGADDYIIKPFSTEELIGRIEAIHRRMRLRSGPAWKSPIVVGNFKLDPDRREVRIKGKPVALAPMEFELLLLLVEAEGRVLSRQRLLEYLWGLDKDAAVSTRTIDQHIARIRHKIHSESHRIISVKYIGYKFIRN